MERILFTVILPVYQVERYLDECLSSFAEQCGSDVQVLLIDDGSTDGSLGILQDYCSRYPCIHAISKPNGGVSSARNLGLELARGEYLLWVDPDDWVAPDWLATIRECVTATRPDMILFDYTTSAANGQRPCHYGKADGAITMEQFLHDLTVDINLTSVLWNKVFRRELFEGLSFDVTLKCMEDADILFRLLPRVNSIQYLHKALYYYRIRNDGLVLNPDLAVAWRCLQLALERLQAVKAMGCAASRTGCYLQAKGFLCKFYRLGFPREWREEYQEVRQWLREMRPRIRRSRILSKRDKLKYSIIGNPVVGVGYALTKGLTGRIKAKHGGVA